MAQFSTGISIFLAQISFGINTYGLSYLDGAGDVVLIYPRTDSFADPLPVFDFPKTTGMRLWVLPFCLKERQLILPVSMHLQAVFSLQNNDGIPSKVLSGVPA